MAEITYLPKKLVLEEAIVADKEEVELDYLESEITLSDDKELSSLPPTLCLP